MEKERQNPIDAIVYAATLNYCKTRDPAYPNDVIQRMTYSNRPRLIAFFKHVLDHQFDEKTERFVGSMLGDLKKPDNMKHFAHDCGGNFSEWEKKNVSGEVTVLVDF